MASLLLSRASAAVGIGLGLSFSLPSFSPFRSAPMLCQYTAPYYRTDSAAAPETGWSIGPNDPLLRKQGRTTNNVSKARTMRQVSLGSVLGLLVGVGLRAFSRVLVVLLGIGVVAVEWAASRGYNLLPVNTMQKYVKSVDLHKSITENMPFKITFGATMALAAFAQF
ncbi:hypothetical protein PHISCL_05673 [Aspergillus sclerotialis]|uniref:FUN14 family n=1 Tax=Aspergillus sclerotialis TaxID=2070753 RepID=A0A3A2ZFP6_9EURO|nr:hypothetical protein PHISCL_05673 [Aspergillus sclerotialis]